LQANHEFANNLKELTRLTSGKIAARGEFALEPKHRDHVKDIIDREEKEAAVRTKKREKRTVDLSNKFKIAATKIRENKTIQNEDYKALIQHYKQPGDSPMKSKISDIRAQWERRSHRHIVADIDNGVTVDVAFPSIFLDYAADNAAPPATFEM
jgi:hypothetical protein